jgi:hypothetical protein
MPKSWKPGKLHEITSSIPSWKYDLFGGYSRYLISLDASGAVSNILTGSCRIHNVAASSADLSFATD